MTTPKQLHQSLVTREKNFATSKSSFIGRLVTPTTSISPTIENHLNITNHQESSQINQLVDSQQQTRDEFDHRKSQLDQNVFEIISNSSRKNKLTNADKTQSNSEDDWVCPVAVALRRAGYDVPLRPSKSWLERDRKKQALLREQQTSPQEF